MCLVPSAEQQRQTSVGHALGCRAEWDVGTAVWVCSWMREPGSPVNDVAPRERNVHFELGTTEQHVGPAGSSSSLRPLPIHSTCAFSHKVTLVYIDL